MEKKGSERRLSAILMADVVGYSLSISPNSGRIVAAPAP